MCRSSLLGELVNEELATELVPSYLGEVVTELASFLGELVTEVKRSLSPM